ncbi:DUF3341 domain-containing protein [Lacipirellula sp.]|uniref:DUF3341 domain-containing protein n=1 Tax=Lacipirellula sp. TaxID=2691419 RepID=UPI003D12981B
MSDHHGAPETPALYGVLGEFADADHLLAAAHKVREAGYVRTDAYAPMPVHGLAEALGAKRTKLPFLVLLGGIVGGLAGFGLCYYCSVIAYPMNIGGRPVNTWPAFIPVTFETTILGAAITAVLGMLALNGLPMPYHPLFNVPEFSQASQSRFFICIESKDKKFDEVAASDFLRSIGATHVTTVDN